MPTTTTLKAVKAKVNTAAKKVVAVTSPPKAPAKKTKASAVKKMTPLNQVAGQNRRKASSVVHMTRDASFKLIDSQRAIWLAGLGALAKVTTSTGSKVTKAFEALVKAGGKLEFQARGAIDGNVNLLKHRINNATKVVDHGIDTVSEAFDARVKQALGRLGYPKAAVAKK
jgi:poly(hydroxyalkanoate) granule-associated protein